MNEVEIKIIKQWISETRSWFFEKISTTDNCLPNLGKEKTQQVRLEKGDIITDTTEIQKIIREYL
jgi:hypothetical protein